VLLKKVCGELVHQLPHQALFLLCAVREQFHRDGRILRQGAGHSETSDMRGWQFEFEVAEHALAYRHQSARPGFFLGGEFGDAPQAALAEQNFNAVGGEVLFVLANDAALGRFEDQNKSSTLSG
jgi:hypothetical protein